MPMDAQVAEVRSPFRNSEQRVADRERKREAVLLAAVRTFNARGFHAASLDDVAATLGVSKPTIYHYLGNKEQVLLECVTRGIAMLQDAVDEAMREIGSGLDRLRFFLVRYAELNMDDFGRCIIRTGEEMLSPGGAQRFGDLKREIDGALRGLIAAGIADGSIAPVEVRIAAFVLAGALNWPARWYDSEGPMRPRELADRMVALLTTGLSRRA
jgi:AcrR family transcriptional regulator